MIYTITFNPSLDYIMHVDCFEEGETNRSKQEEIYPGGKGFNVSTILSRLNLETTALGFVAGFTGEEIVKEAIKNNIDIIPIPGACAFVNSLIVSGISTTEFSFYGFLPLNKKNRKEKLLQIMKEQKTVILYEAPHKLLKTLEDILENIGDVQGCLVRELTKIHEQKIYGTISELINLSPEPKGEYVIVLDLNTNENSEDVDFSKMSLEEHYNFYEKLGLDKKKIIKQIAKDRNVNKNEIYQSFIQKK